MMFNIMPHKSKLKLPPIETGDETIGQRLARLRKERGYTQVELAKKIGIIQVLVSDYERDRLRLNAEMLIRFSGALEISADEILGIEKAAKNGKKPSLKILRRLNRLESLPPSEQKSILKTIDLALSGAAR